MAEPQPALPAGWEELPETARPALLALWQQNQALTTQVAVLRTELAQARRAAITWDWVFHPLTVLALSLGAALAFAALIVVDNDLSHTPGRHGFYLYYMVPISAPFVAFLLDRASRWRELRRWQWAVDLPVVVLGLARALTSLPGISGHALFLGYALLTARSRVAQALAGVVLIQVIYLKIFAWRDPTLFGGLLVAAGAAGLFWYVARQPTADKSDRASSHP